MAVEIGALALIVGVFAFAQRLSAWENKPLGISLAIAASAGLLTWCFLFLPEPVAFGVSVAVWSTGLWFIIPLVQRSINKASAPEADLPPKN